MYRTSLLPFIACVFAVAGMIYSGCSETQAKSSKDNGAAELKNEISQLEMAVQEMHKMNDDQVRLYGGEMGCNTESRTLEIIKKHNDIIAHYDQRLEYHKLQLIQADTINAERNKAQIVEVKNDITALSKDEQEIRKGLGDFTPTHVTK